MAIGDSVVSENTFFWRLLIKPTPFHGSFCTPVTRYFESEPEPCSRQDYRWRCSFTEHMINGVGSVDIEIWRIRAPQQQRQQRSLPHTQAQGHDYQDQPSRMAVVEQRWQAESSSGSTGGRGHPQSVDNRSQQQQHQALAQHPQYQTLSLHTPNQPAAIASVFLHRLFKSGKPLRGKFELDADTILYKNLYDIEFVFSEEAWSYRLPSLMCCHFVLESMYHELVSTCLPDQTMADIWFEFRRSDTMEGQEDNSDSDDEETIVDGDDGGGEVEVVGAHSRVLAQRPYFAAWIECERQKQEEQRRRQLEEEWRIHQQQQPLHQQHASSSYQRRLEQREDEDEQLSSDVTMASGRVRGYIPPPPLQCLASTPIPPTRQGNPFESHLERPLNQSRSRSPSQVDQPPGPVSFQSVSSPPVPGPSIRTSAATDPRLRNISPSSSIPQLFHHPLQPRQALLGHSLPALRIPVQDISLQTFKILLQFIYTGQIGVSQKQLTDIKSYWGENLEDYISPKVESCQQPDQPSHEDTAKQENPLGDMPPLFQALVQEHEHWQRLSLPTLSSCTPFTLESKCPVYATTALSILQRHIPGSNHDPDPGCDPGPSSYPSQRREQGQGQEPSRYEYHGPISWETLLQAARRFGLRDLEHQAMKALQYHSQMLSLRRAIVDNDITAEISHDGSDEPTLDLQLALGEQILRSIIRLHQYPRMMESEDGRVLVLDEQKGEEIEPSIIGGDSTNVDEKEHQAEKLSMTTSPPVGLRMPRRRTENVRQVHLVSPRARELVSWRSVTGPGDEENDQEERGGGGGEDISLFEGSACEEALMELCTELRERFLAMREIMQGSHQ
ncbi:MAG: hypothetical protein J3Q66DRAFT_395534 [Benniella sp.]|nr:MAG: hypothetical protein J3Q66DRAFT_395534 [Benniella sp.]